MIKWIITIKIVIVIDFCASNSTSELESFKSNLAEISLFVWSTALTNSCASNSDTTSKLQSLAIITPYICNIYLSLSLKIFARKYIAEN